MTGAYQLAQHRSQQLAAKNKEWYDRRTNAVALEPGDRVLVRNLSERGGPGKLRAHWENRANVVRRKLGNLPVYEVKLVNFDGRTRTIHRNLLLPCNFLPVKQPAPTAFHSRTEPPSAKQQPK